MEPHQPPDGGPNDGSLCATDLVFEIGEVLVFRGTNGLPSLIHGSDLSLKGLLN